MAMRRFLWVFPALLALATAVRADDEVSLRLTLLDGQRFSLADWRGSPVMVHFWASWCPACIEEMPHLDAACQRYAGQGVKCLAVSMDSQKADLRQFLGEHPVEMPVGWQGASDYLAEGFGRVRMLPATYLIAADGRIVSVHKGVIEPAELDAWIHANGK